MAENTKRRLLLKPYVPIGRACQPPSNKKQPPAPMEITPERIVFKDVLVSQTYSFTLTIRNLTTESRKVRLFHSVSQNFLVQYDSRMISLAAGLSLPITIVFDAKLENMQQFTHELRIVSQEFEKVVEILALRPQVEVECPASLNFGKVEVGSRTIRQLPIINKSKARVTVNLHPEDWTSLRIVPQRVTLKENQSSNISVQYVPEASGLLSTKLHLEIEESSRNSRVVELVGASFVSSYFFTDVSGGRVQKITFSDYYLGQKLSRDYKFFNNTSDAVTVKFCSTTQLGQLKEREVHAITDPVNILSPQKYAKQQEERFLVCHPIHAEIQPFGWLPVKLVAFKKPTAEQIKEFQLRATGKVANQADLIHTEKCTFVAQLVQHGKLIDSLRYPVVSQALLPHLTLSESCFSFGEDVCLKQVSTIKFNIRNRELLPLNLNFQLEPSSHYSIKGGTCHKFQGKETKELEIAYSPRSVGIHAQEIILRVLEYYELRMRTFAHTKRSGSMYSTARQSFYQPTNKENQDGLPKTSSHRRLKNLSSYTAGNRPVPQLSLAKKKLLQKVQQQYQQPIDAEFEAGLLVSPRQQQVKLPRVQDPLYQDNTFKQKQLTRLQPRSNPATARNKQEQQDIQRSLSLEELKAIVVGNCHINFGVMFVNTIGRDSFLIRNNTSAAVLVQLHVNDAKVQIGQPRQQVIQPGHCSAFELKLSSKSPGSYRSLAKYVINGKHSFELLLTANFIAVSLEPSHKHIHIAIDQKDMSFSKAESFRLKNNGNRPVSFSFSSLLMFQAVPKEGEIQPQSEMEIKVVYTPVCSESEPTGGTVDEGRLCCTVEDGQQLDIGCLGSVRQARCSIKQSEINLGEMPVSMVMKSKITVRNMARLATVFRVELQPETLGYYLSFKNQVWNLKAQAKQEVEFKFCCQTDRVIKGQIILHFRGYKKVSVPFYAKSTVPRLTIRQELLDFGEVSCGNTSMLTFHLRNDSKVNGLVEIPLETGELGPIGLTTNHKNRTCLKTTRKVVVATEEDCSLSSSSKQVDEQGEEQEEATQKETQPTYQLTVPPNSELPLRLSLLPTKNGVCEYTLPIYLAGQHQLLDGINRKIRMAVVPACVQISLQIVDFRRCVVNEASQWRSFTVEVANLTQKSLVWGVDTSQPRKEFTLLPASGTIPERGSIKLTASFRPEEPDEFEAVYYFRVAGSGGGGSTALQLIGVGVLPTLLFDRREIILTPVPLGISSRLTVYLLNDGYENVRIERWKLQEQQLEGVQLTFDFTEGRTLSVLKQRLPITIQFKSKQPISFTTMLHVFDTNNIRFSVPLSATADNSIFSIYPYLEACEGSYYLAEQSGVELHEIESEQPTKKKIPLGYSWTTTIKRDLQFNFFRMPPMSVTRRTCSHIVRWLRYFVSDKVDSFPECCIRTNGQPIYNMLAKLTGEAYQQSNSVSEKTAQPPKSMQPQYANLLRRLKEQGCFLNHIRPQYLLSLDEYLAYTNNFDSKYSMTTQQLQLYDQVSAESWAALFFQICRVFLFGRSPAKSLKLLLEAFEVEPKRYSEKLKDSNVFSVVEMRLVSFFRLFAGTSLQSLFETSKSKLLSTVLERVGGEQLSSKLGVISLCSIRTSFEDARYDDLSLMLAEFGVGMYLNQQDIAALSQKQTMLYLFHLAQQLEHLVPRQTITFSCSLGERPQKNIQLKNPSDFEVVYWPKLVGSRDFEVEEDLPIRIGPKQSAEYNVRYVCRFSKPSVAKLFFVEKTSENESESHVSPFVMKLESEVVGKNAIRYVDFQTNQYQLFSIVIDVQCPFTIPGRSPVELSITLQEDNKKKPSCFFLMTNKVRVLRNKQTKVELKFLSFQAEKRSCRLSFFGEVNGEFNYEIRANVLEPLPVANIRLKTIEVGEPQDLTMELSANNEPYQRAIRAYTEYWKFKPKMSELATPPTFISCELLDPCQSITIPDELPYADPSSKQTIPLPIKLQFRRAYKSFAFRVMLRLTPTDVRIFQFTAQVKPKPTIVKLGIETTARTEITQSLPIRLFPSSVRLESESPDLFLLTQLRQFDVDCQIDKIIVVFKPVWVCQFVAKLVIEHSSTLQEIIYEITAKGIEPSPEDTIEVVMQNRNRYSKVLEIECGAAEQFQVVSSLPFCQAKCLSGSSRLPSRRNLSIGAKQQQTFEVELLPEAVGTYEGSLKFVSSLTQQYLWYKLKVQVRQNESSGVIEVAATAGTTKNIVVSKFGNHVGANFKVVIEGSCLEGEPVFNVVDSNSSYSMVYCPNRELKQTGKLCFFDIGRNVEVWYTLKITAERPKPIVLPQTRIGFGAKTTVELSVENTLDCPISYHTSNSNHQYFAVEDIFLLEPKCTRMLPVICNASMVGSVVQTTILLTSDQHLTRQYRLSTLTIPQEHLQTIDLKSQINSSSKQTLLFRNPIGEECMLSFQFGEDNGFEMLTKDGYTNKPRNIMMYHDPAVFTLRFCPMERTTVQNQLKITVNGKYSWSYRLVGKVAQILKKLPNLLFQTTCRKPITRVVEFDDVGNQPITKVEVSKDFATQFQIRTISQEANRLSLQITYSPFKPLERTMVCTTMSNSDGAVWMFDIGAEAHPPEPDDTLLLQANINQTQKVCFRLTNKTKHPAPFTASITQDSSIEFQVEPAVGILEPYGKQGTSIYVSFHPTLYQTRFSGCIVVETDDMYWSFKLIGRLPKYHPPTSPSTKPTC